MSTAQSNPTCTAFKTQLKCTVKDDRYCDVFKHLGAKGSVPDIEDSFHLWDCLLFHCFTTVISLIKRYTGKTYNPFGNIKEKLTEEMSSLKVTLFYLC